MSKEKEKKIWLDKAVEIKMKIKIKPTHHRGAYDEREQQKTEGDEFDEKDKKSNKINKYVFNRIEVGGVCILQYK